MFTACPRHGSTIRVSILTLDIGTSSVKAGIFDRRTLRLLWEGREPLPPATSEGWHAASWLHASSAVLARSSVRISDVEAIVMSGNGPTIIPVSATGEQIDDVQLWFDHRASWIDGQKSFFLPKIAWLCEHRPKVYERTRWFLTCPEYVAVAIGAEPHVATPNDPFSPFIWDAAGIAAYSQSFGLDPKRLPPVVHSGEGVGSVNRRGCELFGVREGTPIFAGGPDFLASLIGTAVVRPGRTCDRAGTSEGINFCSRQAPIDPAVRTLPHAIEGLFNVAGVLSSTGRIFEWFRRLSRQETRGYDEMLGEIAAAGLADRPLFFPSTHAGAAWGFSTGAFVRLQSTHTAVDLGRAVVLAIGFAVRQSIEALGSVGCEVAELRVCGGQARNRIWNQMKAEITGCPIVVPEILDAELLGDAITARIGLGDDDKLVEAAERGYSPRERIEPRPGSHAASEELYLEYLGEFEHFRAAYHPNVAPRFE